MKRKTIHVLTWYYFDGSGHGVIRAYEDKEEADSDLSMLREQAQIRQYELTEVPLHEAQP